jgi:O-methyltransferase involved in polyketide biosynthesis
VSGSGFQYAARAEAGPAGVPGVASPARMYDYWLGGKDNFEADRAAARKVQAAIPHAAQAAQQNRAFLGRVVTYLARDQGIRQFLDIGSGLPTRRNVHEIALGADDGCRVAYVDNDPVALAHARALLATSAGVTVIAGDLRDPGPILADAAGLLDLSQPVAVLLLAVLHFIRDTEDPYWAVTVLKDALAPGSAIAVSHITADGIGTEPSLAAQQVYEGASAPAVPRTKDEVIRFFDGLTIAIPGVTDIGDWPAPPGKPEEPGLPLRLYGGVGLKPK